jgi:hypothetical protein
LTAGDGVKFEVKSTDRQRPVSSDHLDAYVHTELLAEMYSGRRLARLLFKKFANRLFGQASRMELVALYGGLAVFHRPGLHGGGLAFGQDFARVLVELDQPRCETIFEFCSGPGYIGYSLLANGFCKRLTLADVNPAAVQAARFTARHNRIEHRVKVHLSDGLRQIPADERWDLVVGNPPHFLPKRSGDDSLLMFDPDWAVHRNFYSSVGRHLQPGARVVVVEARDGSTPEIFAPMIEAGGGKLVASVPGTDLAGRGNGYYFLVSEWS